MPGVDENGLSAKVLEQEAEIEFLKGEVGRLKARLSGGEGSVRAMLRRRGLRIFKEEPDADVIAPKYPKRGLSDEFYALMKKYSFRLYLRDVIKSREGFRPAELVRYSSLPVVRGYTEFLREAGVLTAGEGGVYALSSPVKSFGPTLEWFVAEVFRREFMADAVWGVRFKDTEVGGDYDLLAAVEGRLVLGEVKSSPPKQIYDSEIRAYIERFSLLMPDISLFIMDTELRMKDKIVALFEAVLPETPFRGLPVARLKAELFHIDGRIFIINSKDSLIANIGAVLGWYLKRSTNAA